MAESESSRHYVEFPEEGSGPVPGLAKTWVEVAPDGRVMREIGFDADGHVIHRAPSARYRHGQYGLFDLTPVKATSDSVAQEDFERMWRRTMQDEGGAEPTYPGELEGG
jgi:hypothetical protein